MKESLLKGTYILLFYFNTGIAGNVPLETLLLAKNISEVFRVRSLQEALSATGVSLHVTTTVMNDSKPFPSLSQALSKWTNIKLLLLSPSFCDPATSFVWLNGLNTPYLCYSETEKVKDIIYTYNANCLEKEGGLSSLKDCLEAVKSTITTENFIGRLITTLQWETMIILFEDRMDAIATSVSSELSSMSVQCLMYRLTSNQTDQDITNLISNAISLVSVSERNFLLLCDGSYGSRILKRKLSTRVTDQASSEIGQNVSNNFSLKTIQSFANEFSDRTTAMRMMSSWLLILPIEDFCILQTIDLAIDNVATVIMPSDMFSYHTFSTKQTTNNCSKVFVNTLLYKPSSRQWSTVACVNDSGHMVLRDAIFPNRHFGFNERKLVVATLRLAPYALAHVDDDNKTTFRGFCMDLLKELAVTLNFTYEVREPDDMEWGKVLNGSWTGIVGLLERLEVDMTVAPLVITQERETVMDFTYPYYYDAAAAIYKLPDKRQSKWLTLVKPFKLEVFVCLGVVFLSMIFFLSCMEYASVRDNKMSTRLIDIVSDCMMYTAGAFFKHANCNCLNFPPGRVLISFLWLFCIIVVAAYSGNLIAFLTVSKTYPPFRTLAEVAQQDEYMWGTDGGSMWTTLFQTSNISDYQMIWKGILSHSKTNPDALSLSMDLHRKMVEDGSYLFFFDRDAIAVWKEGNCDLVLLEETFYQITYGVGLPQNSPYGRMISEKLLKIEQSGLLQIWKGNWWPNGSACAGQLQVEAKAIELIDLQSAFYVLGIGVGTAMLVLFTEWLRRRIRK